jgi:hypothetical protein
MIAPVNGEVFFEDGLYITPHCVVGPLLKFALPGIERSVTRALPRLAGWKQHALGVHVSEHGRFEVEVTSGSENRVFAVFLSHTHPFYEAGTAGDSERRAYHEAVIQKDLKGQREFSWGTVHCRVDVQRNHDWLVLAYTRGVLVPRHVADELRQLTAEADPKEE